jgi:hypothetical protein
MSAMVVGGVETDWKIRQSTCASRVKHTAKYTEAIRLMVVRPDLFGPLRLNLLMGARGHSHTAR